MTDNRFDDDGEWDEFVDVDDGSAPGWEDEPPERMSRRDRRMWRAMQAERLASEHGNGYDASPARTRWGYRRRARRAFREAMEDRAAELAEVRADVRDGSRGGLRSVMPARVPRGLGRRGRRVFREEDRRNRARWWAREQRRTEAQRTAGVPIVMLALALVIFGLWFFRGRHQAPPPAESAPVAATPAVGGGSMSRGSSAAPAESVAAAADVRTPQTSESALSPAQDSRQATSTQQLGTSSPETLVFGNGTNTVPSIPANLALAPDAIRVTAGTVAPAAPPVGPITAAERRDPVVLATAWFVRVCPSDYRQQFGAALAPLRAVMTPRGWAYSRPDGDHVGQAWWKQVVAHRETRVCGTVDVKLFQGPQPTNARQRLLVLAADRMVTAPGEAPRVEQVSQLRYVSTDGSGVWSVGEPAVAG